MDWQKIEQGNCESCQKRLDCVLLAKGVCPMSYLRMGHPLFWFKGDSDAYVFLSSEGIVDYDNDYSDLPSLVELIGIIIERETCDNAFASKIVKLLATKLNIVDELREKPLTEEEYLNSMLQRYGKE